MSGMNHQRSLRSLAPKRWAWPAPRQAPDAVPVAGRPAGAAAAPAPLLSLRGLSGDMSERPLHGCRADGAWVALAGYQIAGTRQTARRQLRAQRYARTPDALNTAITS